MSTVLSIIAFVIIIGLVIFFHEFGHFLLAKMNGIGVVEFSIGFGPKIFSKVKNGTKYSVKWIPFGGYCLLLGQENYVPDPENEGEAIVSDEEHSYSNKSVWRRISVTVAGPIFNFILGFVLATLLVAMIGIIPGKIGSVSPGYPAQEAGLQAGDTIRSLNGEKMHFFKEVSLYMTLHEGEKVEVVYERNGKEHTTTLNPKFDKESGRYLIGITASEREKISNPIEVFKYGVYDLGYNMSVVFKSLGMLFTGRASINDLSGPVGMAGMVNDIVTEVQNDTANEGMGTTFYWILVNLMNFTLLITANLGIINLLPIPGMDGGRLIFLLIEAIIRKPVPKKAEGIVTVAGFIFLIVLMVFVLFNDIRKVFFM